MSPDRAIAALERRIIALFANERDAIGEERSAYLTIGTGDDARNYIYVTFVNGVAKDEGAPYPMVPDLEKAVDDTVLAVASRFYNHADQTIVWRCRPQYEWHEAYPGNAVFGLGPTPAHFTLRVRLVGVDQ